MRTAEYNLRVAEIEIEQLKVDSERRLSEKAELEAEIERLNRRVDALDGPMSLVMDVVDAAVEYWSMRDHRRCDELFEAVTNWLKRRPGIKLTAKKVSTDDKKMNRIIRDRYLTSEEAEMNNKIRKAAHQVHFLSGDEVVCGESILCISTTESKDVTCPACLEVFIK